MLRVFESSSGDTGTRLSEIGSWSLRSMPVPVAFATLGLAARFFVCFFMALTRLRAS